MTPLRDGLDETRLKQAADAVRATDESTPTVEIARAAVEAYLADPKPAWPSDESLRALSGEHAGWGEEEREYLRAAFLADPIIKAAVAWTKRRQVFRPDETYADFCTYLEEAVREAVRDAGLLDD